MKKKNIGSTLDSLFDELGELEDVELLTQKKLLAEKIERAMAKRRPFARGPFSPSRRQHRLPCP